MLRYYKLFDLLNRRGMKKSDLRSILSSSTVAKLSKGEYISGEALDKICLFLKCQPGEIVECVHHEEILDENNIIYEMYRTNDRYSPELEYTENVIEAIGKDISGTLDIIDTSNNLLQNKNRKLK